ncbi:MAG TPA: hypothetical protein VGD10_04705 [Allosphingosinicella sp.]|uniref:hypothetical protein n=1 Tax=Allosphingosinicella sp. TaxID=2823234 RepID=UPI002EDA8FF3
MRSLILAAFAAALFFALPAQAQEAVQLHFDPPEGQAVRYKYERVIDDPRAPRSLSSTFSLRFQRLKEGFRVAVTPETSSFDIPGLSSEMAKRMDAVARMPYALRLSDEGAIVEIEEGDAFWQQLVSMTEEMLSTPGGATPSEEEKAQLQSYVALWRDAPPEVKLNMLTEGLQPIFEYAASEWVEGERVEFKFETPTPFGAVTRHGASWLEGVDGDTAIIKYEGSVPREELDRLMQRLMGVTGGKRAEEAMKELEKAIRGFERRDEGIYRVTKGDGLLERAQVSATTKVSADDEQMVRTDTIKLERLFDRAE